MSEERRYEVVGRVEIGTDEYRDLIESCARAEREAINYRDKFWGEQTKVNSLEQNVEALETYKRYVVENCHDSYKLWLLEKKSQELEDDDF